MNAPGKLQKLLTKPWKMSPSKGHETMSPQDDFQCIAMMMSQVYALSHLIVAISGKGHLLLTLFACLSSFTMHALSLNHRPIKNNLHIIIYLLFLVLVESLWGQSLAALILAMTFIPLIIMGMEEKGFSLVLPLCLTIFSGFILTREPESIKGELLPILPALLTAGSGLLGFSLLFKRLKRENSAISIAYKNLIRTACHDISNPLTLILGASQIAGSGLYDGNTEKTAQVWKKMERSSETINRVLHSLRAFEAIQAPRNLNIGVFNVKDMIMESQVSLIDFARSVKVSIARDQVDDDVFVYVDKHLFQNIVLKNLIYNAIRFSRPGDSITLKAQQHRDYSLITIADEGTGIKESDLKDIFNYDFVKRPVSLVGEKSGGFCLSVTKLVVEAFSGSLAIESQDKGTKILLKIPFSK